MREWASELAKQNERKARRREERREEKSRAGHVQGYPYEQFRFGMNPLFLLDIDRHSGQLAQLRVVPFRPVRLALRGIVDEPAEAVANPAPAETPAATSAEAEKGGAGCGEEEYDDDADLLWLARCKVESE